MGSTRLVLAAVENDWRALQFAAASLRRRGDEPVTGTRGKMWQNVVKCGKIW